MMIVEIIGLSITIILLIIATVVDYLQTSSKRIVGGSEKYSHIPNANQLKVQKKYNELKAPKKLPTFDEFCFPKKFQIQRQQKFAAEYMDPKNNHKKLIIYHRIGAGKSCLAIQTGLRWISKGKPLYIMPASLIENFKADIRGNCGGYLTSDEQKQLAELVPGTADYSSLITTANDRAANDFQIYSYNKFIDDHERLESPIIIIDEAQNVINPNSKIFRSLKHWVVEHPTAVIMLMSGTIIFDSAKELNSLAELLGLEVDKTKILTPDETYNLFSGYVSYFEGAPEYTYPDTEVKIKKCKMSKFQAKWYKATAETEIKKDGDYRLKDTDDSFYIKSRRLANIVFPHGLSGEEGLRALTSTLIKNSLCTYSIKFYKLIKKLQKGELSFVYTSFTKYGGICALIKCLKVFGFKDFAESGPGPRRFAIWSGDQTRRYRDVIRNTFNAPNNDNSSQIQVIIGSPSIKEGVSLLRVREVHIMEPYWNHSRMEQIYGRASRYCSHKTLPKKDRNVMIYIYCAIAAKVPKIPTALQSVDLYMLHIADEKKETNYPYIQALAEGAVDRLLHYPNR